ncbi:hypothetical protein BT69DRAFT_1321487 [Atractiella rhizophila]|nr:hypothetical protein BT69DRAFT_1321487 [Atractiella rhizophila]
MSKFNSLEKSRTMALVYDPDPYDGVATASFPFCSLKSVLISSLQVVEPYGSTYMGSGLSYYDDTYLDSYNTLYDEYFPLDEYPGRVGYGSDLYYVDSYDTGLYLDDRGYGYGLGLLDNWDYYGFDNYYDGGLTSYFGDNYYDYYGGYGTYDASLIGLDSAYHDEFYALQDLRQYEDALRLDAAISEEERIRRWRMRLSWEELDEEQRQLRWAQMAEEEREILGLGLGGWWGRRYGPHYGYDFESWAQYVPPHGGPGSYAQRHPELWGRDSNPHPQVYGGYGMNYYLGRGAYGPSSGQLRDLRGVYQRAGHYPLSRGLASRYNPVLSRLANTRRV